MPGRSHRRPTAAPSTVEIATAAIVRINGGRGFIVAGNTERFVITAAHCPPQLPPPDAASYAEERIYLDLLAPLNDPNNTLAVECVFADPISDLAVLRSPDSQGLPEAWLACERLLESAPALRIAPATLDATVWLLGLNRRWMHATILHAVESVSIKCDGVIRPGMSGSPILDTSGAAVAVLGQATGTDARHTYSQSELNPQLVQHLPQWLVHSLTPPA